MNAMEIGDLVSFYHSVYEKQIVGIAEVCAKYDADPTDAKSRFSMVSIRVVKTMGTPVTLTRIKNDKRLSDMALVPQALRSVTQVPLEH